MAGSYNGVPTSNVIQMVHNGSSTAERDQRQMNRKRKTTCSDTSTGYPAQEELNGGEFKTTRVAWKTVCEDERKLKKSGDHTTALVSSQGTEDGSVPTEFFEPLHLATRDGNISWLRCSADYLDIPGIQDGPHLKVDSNGFVRVRKNAHLTSRYKTCRVLGSGSFGKVVECWDEIEEKAYALKISRATKSYRRSAKEEIRIILAMMKHDPCRVQRFSRLSHWFTYKGVDPAKHVVMVFELLGEPLSNTIQMSNKPFLVSFVRKYMKQIFETLEFMHALGIVHTDVKPENILHARSRYDFRGDGEPNLAGMYPMDSSLTLIDFGSSVFEEEKYEKLITTRYYRSPEVILGIGWSFETDVWSCGCIIMELVTGRPFFKVRNDKAHLAMIEKVLSTPMPQTIANLHHDKRTSESVLLAPGSTQVNCSMDTPCNRCLNKCACGDIVDSAQPLEAYFDSFQKATILDPDQIPNLHSLAKACLTWDPSKRIRCSEALKHPFFD